MTLPGIQTQRDPEYAYDELGFNTDPYYNIYHFGCLITSVANLIWSATGNKPTPRNVNDWLKGHNGFEVGGGNMVWSMADSLLAEYNLASRGYSSDLNEVNSFLQADDNFALVWLTKPGFPMHWALSPYVGMIADPWDGVLKPTTSYTFLGAHLYSKVPVVTPAPIVEPTPPVAEQPLPPIVDPAPEPVPSVTTPIEQPEVNVIPMTEAESIPEYTTSYVEFTNGVQDMSLSKDTDAVDFSGVNPPMHLKAGQTVKLGGSFTYQNNLYYAGTNNKAFGVLQGAFGAVGQANGVPNLRLSPGKFILTSAAVGAEVSRGAGWVRQLLRFLWVRIINISSHKG